MSDEPARPVCRHCNTRPVNRPRGLCWNCYYAPGVRDLYPSTSKFAKNYDRHEPTEAELEQMIAEQMQNLPAWWFDDVNQAREGRTDEREVG